MGDQNWQGGTSFGSQNWSGGPVLAAKIGPGTIFGGGAILSLHFVQYNIDKTQLEFQ